MLKREENIEMRKNRTIEEVEKICRLLEEGYTPSLIAEKMNVGVHYVKNIKYGRSYQEISKKYDISKRHKKKVTDEETVRKICQMIKQGIDNKEISAILGVEINTVSQIACGKIFSDIVKSYKLDECEKLDDKVVHKICKMMEDNTSTQKISVELGIPMRIISMIRSGFIYNDIRSLYEIKTRLLKDDQVHNICKLLEEGYSNNEIANITGINESIVCNIRCGKTYKNISKSYNFTSCRKSRELIHNICGMIKDGYRTKDICKILKIERNSVDNIRFNNAYHDIAVMYGIENSKYTSSKTNNIYKKIIVMLENGYSVKEIKKDIKVSERTIYRIRKEITIRNEQRHIK